jgi:hypothetical protein
MEMPNEKIIENVLNRCSELEELGESRYTWMSYEQGVKAGIEWLLGYGENPM